MSALSPFAAVMLERAAAMSSRRLAPAVTTTPRCNAPAKTVPSQVDRSTKPTSSSGILPQGRRVASKVGGPGNFLHLNTTSAAEHRPTASVASCAAAILDLPEARQHPATAARLAADPTVSLASARAVLQSIAPAAAAAANAEQGSFVADLMLIRGKIDGQVHAAHPLTYQDRERNRLNARAQRIETAGLSEADRAEFARVQSRLRQERAS